MAQRPSDLSGKKFGMLVAIKPTEQRNHNKTVMWLCKCLGCQAEIVVASTKLKEGGKKSCGCQMRVKSARTPKGFSGFNTLLKRYQYGAKSRGLPFDLTTEQFEELVKSNCAYCGIEPYRSVFGSRDAKKEYGRFVGNGVDRVDNTRGYTFDNCVAACPLCNKAKGNKSKTEFLNWVSRLKSFNCSQ